MGQAEQIAAKVIDNPELKSSVFGYIYSNLAKGDEAKCNQFLHEVFEQTHTNYEIMKPVWTAEHLDEIIEYCKNNPKQTPIK